MKFEIYSSQRGARLDVFRIAEATVDATPSATTTEMPEGYTLAVVSEGANNVYTLTFNKGYARAPVAIVQAVESGTGVSYICNLASTSATAISWRVENDASAAGAPTGFHVFVMGFDTADQL